MMALPNMSGFADIDGVFFGTCLCFAIVIIHPPVLHVVPMTGAFEHYRQGIR